MDEEQTEYKKGKINNRFYNKKMIRAMVKTAAFPHYKEIDEFDFSFQESINKQQIMDFMTHRFISEKENIVFLGNSGVGKTHLATSILLSVMI